MKKISFFLAVLYSFFGFSQSDFIEINEEIKSVAFRNDKEQVVVATEKKIYVVDVAKFKITDSYSFIKSNNKEIASIKYLNGNDNNVVIKTKRKYMIYVDCYEYPQDSTYIVNLANKKIISAFPGAIYFSTTYDKSSFVLGENGFYKNPKFKEYLPENGALILNKKEKIVKANNIIRNITISRNNKEIAIIYYSSIGMKNILEIRDLKDLSILKSVEFKHKPLSINFSKDGKYLALKKTDTPSSSDPNEIIDIYETKTLKKITHFPEGLFIENTIIEGNLWRMEDSQVLASNLKNSKTTTKIWANLTPFSSIKSFTFINKEELLLFGNGSKPFDTRNGIYKYHLKKEAYYSDYNKPIENKKTILNLEKPVIQNNMLKSGASKLIFKDKLMLNINKTQIEIWELAQRRKLYEINFKNSISAFLSNDEKQILIFEELKEGQSFNNFTLKVLDLKTGVLTSKNYKDEVNIDFSVHNAKCFQNKGEESLWTCFNYSSKVFTINPEKLEVKIDYDLKQDIDESLVVNTAQQIKNSSNYLITSFVKRKEIKKEIEILQLYNAKKKTLTNFNYPENAYKLYPISNHELVFQDNKDLRVEVYNWKTNSKKIIDHKTDWLIDNVLVSDASFFINYFKQNNFSEKESYLYDKKDLSLIKSIKTPYVNLDFNGNKTLYYDKSVKLSEHNILTDKTINWNNPIPIMAVKSNDLQINDNGVLSYTNYNTIDLKKIELTANKDNSPKVLLRNKFSGQSLYLMSNRYDDDTSFRYEITDSKDEILFTSEKITLLNNQELPDRILLADSGNIAFSYNSIGKLNYASIFNIKEKTNKLLHISNLDNMIISNVLLSKDGLSVLIAGWNSNGLKKIQKYSLTTNELITEQSYVPNDEKYDLQAYLNLSLIQEYSDDYTLKLDNTSIQLERKKDTLQFYTKNYITNATYLKNKGLIIGFAFDGKLEMWDINQQYPIKSMQLSSDYIVDVKAMGTNLYVLSQFGKIYILSLKTKEIITTLTLFLKENGTIAYAFTTPEGYFKSSKQDIRQFHFVKNLKAYPLINYELFLNRPDIILKRLGFANNETINIYKEAYLKRLKRNGFTEQTDYLAIEKPSLVLKNKDNIPTLLKEEKLNLEIASLSKIKELTIYINGVPVIQKAVKNKQLFKEEIVLSNGLNNITILAKNKEGIESDPIAFEVTNTMAKRPSKLYYIGIGVSKYKDSTMNLRFADKDVRSLSRLFKKNFNERLIIDTLTNQNATKENILALREKLKQTNIDDMVIVSFSGHGMVDDKNDFFFASHDINFEKPQENGLSYENIQSLLNNIPARKKLLLIDACNSGEIDQEEERKDDTSFTNKNVKGYVPVGAKTAKPIILQKGVQNSFELMQSLFYDLDRGNGSFIISAAGGKEYAYESKEWNNGVFTYSYIKAFNELKHNGNTINISALKDLIYTSVKELTNGKQKPTSRSENVEWDWRIE